VLVDFQPLPGSKIGEFSARFDIAFSRTPQEAEDGKLTGGIGKSEGGGRGPGFGPPPPRWR
jgi:hypothetical protein